MSSEKKKYTLSEHPELKLVWPALIGGGLGAIVGTWIYPDIGSILGTICGIIIGTIVGTLLYEENEEDLEEIITLDISKEAEQFFQIKEKTYSLEQPISLPATEKKVAKDTSHDKEYTLRLFEQAVTSRKTGIFPHRRNKQ